MAHYFLRQTGVVGLKGHSNADPQVIRMVTKTNMMFTFTGGYPFLKLTGGKPDPLPPERHELLRLNTTKDVMFLQRNGNNIVKLI